MKSIYQSTIDENCKKNNNFAQKTNLTVQNQPKFKDLESKPRKINYQTQNLGLTQTKTTNRSKVRKQIKRSNSKLHETTHKLIPRSKNPIPQP